MLTSVIAVASGGAFGAVARFLTITAAQLLFSGRFPLGTLLVNCLGSFLIGLFMSLYMERLADVEHWRLLIVVGFLGGYTTFSTYAWETWALYMNGQWLMAMLNILFNNVFTIILVILGMLLGRYTGGIK